MRSSEPERAIDREEREGLVSLPLFLLFFPLLFLVIWCCLHLFIIFFIAIFFLAGAWATERSPHVRYVLLVGSLYQGQVSEN